VEGTRQGGDIRRSSMDRRPGAEAKVSPAARWPRSGPILGWRGGGTGEQRSRRACGSGQRASAQ
jgi:hypothetical protein